jgi:DNA-binding NtrC family response regulator
MTTPVENAVSRTILVVDDEPQIRKSLQKVLRAEGYEVVLAVLYCEAIEQFNTRRIDLVLLDLSLPGSSGWDIFESLTALNPTLPIIIITGHKNQSEFAAAVGVSAFMEKPLRVPLLLKNIAELLEEEPQMRLERLVGQSKMLRYGPPSSNGSSKSLSEAHEGNSSKHAAHRPRRSRLTNCNTT